MPYDEYNLDAQRIKDFEDNYRKSGFVLIYPSMLNHEYIGFEKPFQKCMAWQWMLFECCRKKEGREKKIDVGGIRMIREEYGEFCHSIRFMANAWGWSTAKVRTFTQHLSNTKPPTIALNVTHRLTKISICNFEIYQNPKHSKQKTDSTAIAQRKHSDSTNYNSITSKQVNKELYSRVVNYLNGKTGSHYKTTSRSTRALIQTRLDEGFSSKDFKVVIDKKCSDWLKDPEMAKYLRPKTLFGTKFESYLNQQEVQGDIGTSEDFGNYTGPVEL